MKAPRLAVAMLSLAALAACADDGSVTGAHAPARPAFNAGGFGMGSGGVVPTDTTQAATMDATAPVAPDSSNRRGGFGMGSGG
ncbi:MAG TPA: hypothetical protein VF613_07720 [Longimicrobium sp.]|jgi:hypothetical protein